MDSDATVDSITNEVAILKASLTPVEALQREIDRVEKDVQYNIETQPTDDCLRVVRDSRVELAALELAKADAVLHEFNVNAERFGETLYGPHKDAEKSVLDARANLYGALES